MCIETIQAWEHWDFPSETNVRVTSFVNWYSTFQQLLPEIRSETHFPFNSRRLWKIFDLLITDQIFFHWNMKNSWESFVSKKPLVGSANDRVPSCWTCFRFKLCNLNQSSFGKLLDESGLRFHRKILINNRFFFGRQNEKQLSCNLPLDIPGRSAIHLLASNGASRSNLNSSVLESIISQSVSMVEMVVVLTENVIKLYAFAGNIN